MMDINILKYLFIFMTLFIVLVGNSVNFLEEHLPRFIVQSFRYGKFAYVGSSSVKLIEVPKKWFRHFYVFASLYSFSALYLAVDVYFFNRKVPPEVFTYLDIFGGSSRSANVDPLPVLLALTLLCLQSFRRFYETWFVSVFSKSKMNLSHYVVGYGHYWGAVTIILAEAKGFTKHSDAILKINQLSLLKIASTLLFLFAWYNQYQCAKILANLRKGNDGQVVTTAHKIPHGGLFEKLSSPHLLCEVLLYVALAVILHPNQTFIYVCLWVAANQAETAYLTHSWYRKTFKSYPKNRKAFIPYLL